MLRVMISKSLNFTFGVTVRPRDARGGVEARRSLDLFAYQIRYRWLPEVGLRGLVALPGAPNLTARPTVRP